MKPNRRALLLLVSILISVAVIVYVLTTLDWTAIAQTLLGANWVVMAVALAGFIFSHVLRTLRFQALIYSQQAPFGVMFSVNNLHAMFTYMLPARTGELTYLYLTRQNMGVALSESTVTLLIARVLDFIFIAVLIPLVMIVFWAKLPGWMVTTGLSFSILVYGVFIGLFLYVRSDKSVPRDATSGRGKLLHSLRELWEEIIAGMRIIDERRIHARLLILTTGIWLATAGYLYFIVQSLGFPVTFLQVIVILVIMIPVSMIPVQGLANLGTHEMGWVAALLLFSYPYSTALAIAFGTHIVSLLFVLLLGGLGAAIRLLNLRSRRLPQSPSLTP